MKISLRNTVVLLLALCGCATSETFKLRAEAASLYRNCVDIYRDRKMCAQETARWCLDHDLEASCFDDPTQRRPFSSPQP